MRSKFNSEKPGIRDLLILEGLGDFILTPLQVMINDQRSGSDVFQTEILEVKFNNQYSTLPYTKRPCCMLHKELRISNLEELTEPQSSYPP